jgi:hypothetical protein
MGANESGAVKSPSKSSQTPYPQQLTSHSRLSQERKMPGRVKSPDSARPQLRMQNARRSRLDRASCTMFRIATTLAQGCQPVKEGEDQLGIMTFIV